MIADAAAVLSNLHGLQCAISNRLGKNHMGVLDQAYNAIAKLQAELRRLSTPQEKLPVVIRGGRSDQYPSVNLNGFTLVSTEAPPPHQPVILGYRSAYVPEVWFGIGYRDPSHARDIPDRYWLGPRGLNPHFDGLSADDVIIWRSFEKPFCFEPDKPGESTYLQWGNILGDLDEDAAFEADEANAAYWDAQPEASIELPWKAWNGNGFRGIGGQYGYVVATGHPVGFGINGGSMPSQHHGQPLLILDPSAIPESLWRDGSISPQRTVRGYHASRFALGEFDGWWSQQSGACDYAPLICMNSGATLDSSLHWSPAWHRGRGGHGIRRWVSFRDLWHSLPRSVRIDHRYEWHGMRRGYERVERVELTS